MRYNFACALCDYLKDADGALELMGPVFEKANLTWLKHMKIDPDLDAIRGDPRFAAMVAAAEARLAAADEAAP